MTTGKSIPSASVSYARTGRTTRSNELGMRPMQERAWEKRGERHVAQLSGQVTRLARDYGTLAERSRGRWR